MSGRLVGPVRVAPLLTWILIQLAALGLGASGLPFWSHHPWPRESIAIDVMAAIQIAAAAMLFPVLLLNVRTSLIVIAVLWPFLHLAGLLSGTPEMNLLLGCLNISIWVFGLACCTPMLKSPAATSRAVSLAQILSIGGALFWYLYLEAKGGGAPPELFGPVVGTIKLVNGSDRYWLVFGEASLPLLIAALNAIRMRAKPSSA